MREDKPNGGTLRISVQKQLFVFQNQIVGVNIMGKTKVFIPDTTNQLSAELLMSIYYYGSGDYRIPKN